jgi:hypothetical protein
MDGVMSFIVLIVIMMSMWKPTVSWRRLKLVVLDRVLVVLVLEDLRGVWL